VGARAIVDENARLTDTAEQSGASVTPELADPTAYNAFVASVALTAINVVGVGGERRMAGDASQTRFDLTAGYQIEDGAIHYRFDAIGHLADPAGADYGQVSAAVVVTLTLTEPAPPPACVERFGGQSAAMMAHPYLREALGSTALRLGFGGVLLPMVTRQPAPPVEAAAD
jgi:hypothetical protein